jgi:Recombinase
MAYLTIAAAARHCGVARRTLQRAIKAGRLALTPDHHVTLEALSQAGYAPATATLRQDPVTTQGPVTETPLRQHDTSRAVSQDLAQVLSQAMTPLIAQLEALVVCLQNLCHMLASQRPTAGDTTQGHVAAPPQDPVLTHILRWQDEGLSLRAIAAKLNAEGVPTRSGQGKWYQSNLSRELRRVERGR